MVEILHGSPEASFSPLANGERMATDDEARRFWIEGRLRVAERVYAGVNSKLQEHYGGPEPAEFSPELFQLVVAERPDSSTRAGGYDPESDRIILVISQQLHDSRSLAEVIAHEVGESRSSRLSSFQESFRIFDEAVIEKTSQRFLYELAPDLKDDPDPNAYNMAIGVLNEACKNIYFALPEQFNYPHEVFELFQRAVFSEGYEESLFDTFSEAYGEGSLDLLVEIASGFKGGVSDRGLKDISSGNKLKYMNLLKFLNMPKSHASLEAAIQRGSPSPDTEIFNIGDQAFEIDYSSVPEGVPLGDWHDGENIRLGVHSRVSRFLDYFAARLSGDFESKRDFASFSIGDIPRPRESYVPDSDYVLQKRVDNAAYEIISTVVGEEEKPEFIVKKSKEYQGEYHRAAGLRVMYDRVAYLMHNVRLTGSGRRKTDSVPIFPVVLSEDKIAKLGGRRPSS